jgi:hypothetical protein
MRFRLDQYRGDILPSAGVCQNHWGVVAGAGLRDSNLFEGRRNQTLFAAKSPGSS